MVKHMLNSYNAQLSIINIKYRFWQQLLMIQDQHQHDNTKLLNFQNQIRRNQRSQIFAQKRKLFNQQNQHECTSRDLLVLDQSVINLKNQRNVSETLRMLGNVLYKHQILANYLSENGQAKLQTLCSHIVHLLFNVIIPGLSPSTPQGLQSRKNCLVIVSNILADPISPKQILIQFISDGISSIYGSVSEYGKTAEILQIGWILGNTFCHQLKISDHQLQKPLEILLSWAEQILTIKETQLLTFLYITINNFFRNIDTCFKINQQSITQYFKTYRLILLEQAVEQNCTIKIGSSLLHLLTFVDDNITYLKLCDHTIQKIMLEKCMKMFPELSQQKMLTCTLNIMVNLSKNEEFAFLIYHHSLVNIITILASHSIKIKQKCLQILNKIIITEQQARQLFKPYEVTDLQNLLKAFIRNIRDCDILMEIIKLSLKVIQLTKYQCGKQLIVSIQENLLTKSGAVGNQAYRAVEYYSLQKSPNCFGPYH